MGLLKFDVHQILRSLPHRYPFLLVDRVLRLEKGDAIQALKNVTVNEPFFRGHFPHRPVIPGAMVLEALAQSAALLAFASFDEVPDETKVYYFGGIDAARFRRAVEPGDRLVMDVRLVRRKSSVFKFEASARVDGALAVRADLLCTGVILS